MQGNPALKPPLNKGLKIFAPKKRTDWGLGASPQQGTFRKFRTNFYLKKNFKYIELL